MQPIEPDLQRNRRIMTKNIGTSDKAIRVILAIVVAILYLTGTISGVTALIGGIIAAIFILTSLIRFCPLYVPLKFQRGKNDWHCSVGPSPAALLRLL
jgi:hypothetical protein